MCIEHVRFLVILYYRLGLYREAEKQFRSALSQQEVVDTYLYLAKVTGMNTSHQIHHQDRPAVWTHLLVLDRNLILGHSSTSFHLLGWTDNRPSCLHLYEFCFPTEIGLSAPGSTYNCAEPLQARARPLPWGGHSANWNLSHSRGMLPFFPHSLSF